MYTNILSIDKLVACNELLCRRFLVGKAVVAQVAVAEVVVPLRAVGVPCGKSTPVFPPTEESTCANNDVGIWTKLIPLR